MGMTSATLQAIIFFECKILLPLLYRIVWSAKPQFPLPKNFGGMCTMQKICNLFKLFICFSILTGFSDIHAKQIEAASQTDSRPYSSPITDAEKRDIRYIIITLATKSYFSLLMQQRSLTDAGNRTAQIHPLKYLEYIFSDPELRSATKNIKGMPWNRFAGDMAHSLNNEYENGTLNKEQLKSFSQSTNISEANLMPYFENEQWKELIFAMQKHS